MNHHKMAAIAALTASAGLCLSGCDSSSDPSASDIATKAKNNAISAKSTSMSVNGTVQGQKVTLEATGTLDGKNQRQSQSASQLKSEEYVVADSAYFKANSDFLAANGMGGTQAKDLADQWWSKPLGGSSQSAAVDIKTLITQFFASADGKKLSSDAADVKKTTTAGQPTYTVSDKKNPNGTQLVTTRGASPQIVAIQNYASSLTQNTRASYTFTEWNKVPMFKAPSGAKPITEAPTGKSSSASSSSATK